jgi:hypothetical protein
MIALEYSNKSDFFRDVHVTGALFFALPRRRYGIPKSQNERDEQIRMDVFV